jgi:hypothetical protein
LASLKSEPSRPLLPALRIGDAQTQEGAPGSGGTLEIPVTLSLSTDATVTVGFETRESAAIQSDDYVGAVGTITFPPGELVEEIEISLIGDAIAEPDEAFFIDLSQPTSASIEDPHGVATIVNDDTTPAVSISDTEILEGDAGSTEARLDVTLSAPVADPVTISFVTSDGTAIAGEDFVAASGTVDFSPGEVTRSISLDVFGDMSGEPDEEFFVDLSDPVNATIITPRGVVSVINDDPIISLSVNDVSVTEGNGGTASASFTVSLSDPSTDEVTAAFTTRDDTAIAGQDYASASGTLTFAPGQMSKQVVVSVFGDTLYEPAERFVLDLTSGSVWLRDPRGVATIHDDEPLPSITIGDILVTEGNSGTKQAVFTLRLSGPSATPIDVGYTTTNDTARAGSDYLADSGVLRFPPGAVQITISISVLGDTVFENGERFFVDLSAPVGASIADGRGIGTIKNDDPKV